MCVTEILKGCYTVVKRELQGCCRVVTGVKKRFYRFLHGLFRGGLEDLSKGEVAFCKRKKRQRKKKKKNIWGGGGVDK